MIIDYSAKLKEAPDHRRIFGKTFAQLARVRSHPNLQLEVKAGASVMAEWG